MARIQRLIGIDYGTSTSIIKVKRYDQGRPVGDSHVSSSVTFGNGESDSKAVTAVRVNREGPPTCGAEALDLLPGSTIYQEFKMDLESPDREKRRQAMERTEDFFRYLYSWYDHQRSDLGAIDDEEQTLVSYPVKWRPEAREYLLETARQAGFRNVRGMDEPTAALYATLARKIGEIGQQGLLRAGESGYMLLVDMGAGTTDLAVCRYRVKADGGAARVDQIENEIIATWPLDSGAATFGGREVDRVLEEYVIDYLTGSGFPAENAAQAVRGSGNASSAAKRWKETTVSKVLNEGKRVETCAFVAPFAMFLPQAKPFPAFGRQEFEAMLAGKLEEFKDLVAGCLAQASREEPELMGKQLDLVILTGGHSSWYFAEELLSGVMPGLSLPQLELVQKERSRVIRLSNPQETVALGLVYSQLPFRVAGAEQAAEEKQEPPAGVPSKEGRGAPPPHDPADMTAAENTGKGAADIVIKTAQAVDQGEKVADAAKNGQDTGTSSKSGTMYAPDAPIPEKWPTNDQLALCAKEFINHYDGSIKKVVRGGLPRIRECMNVPKGDEVFLYHDDTLLNMGTKGFAFCTSGIITGTPEGRRTFVSWLPFATGVVQPLEAGKPVLFYDSIGITQMLAYCTRGFTTAGLHRFLCELQAHLIRTFGLKTVTKKLELEDAGGVSDQQLAQGAARFLAGYDKDLLARAARGNPATIRKTMKIPADAEIYLYHDDTAMQNGKAGFAITDRGFYCISGAYGKQPIFTEWRVFFANSLEVNDPKSAYNHTLCRHSAADGVTKPIAHISGACGYSTFALIAHLHAYLRELS